MFPLERNLLTRRNMSVKVTVALEGEPTAVCVYPTGVAWQHVGGGFDGADCLQIVDASGNILAEYSGWHDVSTDQYDVLEPGLTSLVDVPDVPLPLPIPEVESPTEDIGEPIEETGTIPTPAPIPDP